MTPPGSGFDERVVVIEYEAFRNLWTAELDGGLIVEKEDADEIRSATPVDCLQPVGAGGVRP